MRLNTMLSSLLLMAIAVAGASPTAIAQPHHLASVTTGPLLTVDGDLISPIVTDSTATPPVEIELPAQMPVVFCWSADASAYGGVVTGYRYGWDVLDPDDDDDPGWVSGFVPFTQQTECSGGQSFTVGVHTFTVEAIDDAGHKSRAVVVMTVVAPIATEARSWGKVKASYR